MQQHCSLLERLFMILLPSLRERGLWRKSAFLWRKRNKTSYRTRHDKDGPWKVSFNLAAPFNRVRSGKPQRLRYTALNGTSSSAPSRQPREAESSIRVPGHVPVTRIHPDSSQCLARALAPPISDTRTSAGGRSARHGIDQTSPTGPVVAGGATTSPQCACQHLPRLARPEG